MTSKTDTFGIVVHGGAGGVLRKNYSAAEEKQQLDALEEAMEAGYKVLRDGGRSLDAVTEAVKSFEDCPLYNAGKGAVYNAAGTHELDASIMDGSTKACGGVGIVRTLKNPILLARQMMEASPHTLLAAEGAEQFAVSTGLELVENEYFGTEKRWQQYLEAQKTGEITLDHGKSDDKGSMGTVGAVALDQHGNLAAATSTGGLTHKMAGRIGDSAIVGAGTYANNDTVALSCTGTGDVFLALSASKTVSDLMEYKGFTLEQAVNHVLEQVKDHGGNGGLIGITKDAEIIEAFNTSGMFRAHHLSNGAKQILMYGDNEE